jgi:aldehyde dehydrogenase (NAD+)
MTTFTHTFDTPTFKKAVNFATGIFIDNKFSDGADKTLIE